MIALWRLTAVAVLSAHAEYSHYPDMNCEIGHGAIVIDTKNATTKTITECEAFCDATPECHCVVMTTTVHPGALAASFGR